MAILHITFSLSTQGSLKRAIRLKQLQREESVVCINDCFSIGPLTNAKERNDWLHTYIIKDEDERELYADMQKEWAKKIEGIPCNVDVWIWYSQNSHEEIGLRFVMNEFAKKCNMVFGIDATKGLKRMKNNVKFRHTGELSADTLMSLRAFAERLTVEEENQLANEWQALQAHPSTLRIWEDEIKQVEETFYDEKILDIARYEQKLEGDDWILPMRVVSEVVDQLLEYVEESFFEKRILELAEQGHFEVDGDTSDYYKYRLKFIG